MLIRTYLLRETLLIRISSLLISSNIRAYKFLRYLQ